MYGELIPIGGGDSIPLRREELLVGRKPPCDIVLNFSNVSSKHCRLVLSAGYWYVEDLQSTNGVKVNGAKVSDHRIDPGGVLSIAKHDFRLHYDPAKNGAMGPPPPDVLKDGDILSRSLMEKAGLERPTRKKEDFGSTIPDMPIIITPTPAPIPAAGPKEFLSKLVFD